MAVSRHGINRGEAGPMLRASFEETVEVLMTAAMYSQYDSLDGVTENIMMGQLARVGTGIVDLLLDYDKLKHAIDYNSGKDGLLRGEGENVGDASPASYGTPYASSPSGFFGGSTPLMGAFTPSNTPAYGYPTPAGAGAASQDMLPQPDIALASTLRRLSSATMPSRPLHTLRPLLVPLIHQ